MDIPLDEVIYFDAISSGATGVAADADSTPTFAVYEEATDTDIGIGGNMTKRTSLTGNYRGSFTASAANGFEVGKWYAVIGSATIGAIACKGVLKSFRLVAAEAIAGKPKVDADGLAGQTITAAAGVTFPSSIASPTNITAGTITTVTNLTNAPTNGDLTAAMKASVNTEADAALVDVGLTSIVTARIDAAISSRLAGASYTAPPTAAQNAAATRDVDNTTPAANSLGAHAKSASDSASSAATNTTDLPTLIENVSGKRFTTKALEQAPSGGGGFPTAAQIAAATATLLGDNPVQYQTTVTDDGRLDLVQGMDYYTADGRDIEFTFIRDYVPSSCKLTIASGSVVTVTSTDISESSGSGSGRFHVRFQLPRTDGDDLEAGPGSFEVYSIVGGREVAEISEGVATIRRRLTAVT
jgi:hypothetical protein